MKDKTIWEMPMIEEQLLKEIEYSLRDYGAMERPLKARDMMVTIPTDKWAQVMAWAQIGLRDYVLAKKHSIEQNAVTIKPIQIPPM